MRTFYVAYNKKSGGLDQLEQLKKAFVDQNLHAQFVPINEIGTVKAKGGVIVAAGGDGTIHTVANVLVGSDTPMGVLPLGTLNHFAKDAGIPLDLDKAVACLAKGHLIKIDAVEVNNKIFVNNSSLGIYPASLRTRSELTPHVGKWPAALLGVVRAIVRSHTYHIELTADNKQAVRTTPFIFIGNNPYRINDFGFTNRTALATGKMCVYVVRANRTWSLVRVLLRALIGRLHAKRDFETFLTTGLTISSRRKKLHVSLDGELTELKSPLRYRIRAKDLTVIVPKT